ncbi:MAG: hypothetical protein ACREOP_03065, partial [Thermodesulfobacteriota bacterium]
YGRPGGPIRRLRAMTAPEVRRVKSTLRGQGRAPVVFLRGFRMNGLMMNERCPLTLALSHAGERE